MKRERDFLIESQTVSACWCLGTQLGCFCRATTDDPSQLDGVNEPLLVEVGNPQEVATTIKIYRYNKSIGHHHGDDLKSWASRKLQSDGGLLIWRSLFKDMGLDGWGGRGEEELTEDDGSHLVLCSGLKRCCCCCYWLLLTCRQEDRRSRVERLVQKTCFLLDKITFQIQWRLLI